tara:strand:+ start:275 stop:478 length:204 start_codon:yes stop_codon:yes gene_type:complete
LSRKQRITKKGEASMNKKYLFYLRCEITLHKREKILMPFYTFFDLLKMLREEWYNLTDETKKELGYN